MQIPKREQISNCFEKAKILCTSEAMCVMKYVYIYTCTYMYMPVYYIYIDMPVYHTYLGDILLELIKKFS